MAFDKHRRRRQSPLINTGEWIEHIINIRLMHYTHPYLNELAGVGPVDNRPSTDYRHQFVQFFLKYNFLFILFFL